MILKKITSGGLAPFALIVLAVLWIYLPAIYGGWIWDDVAEVTENAVLRDPGGLPRIWSDSSGLDYFPLKTTVQWLVWRVAGEKATAFHAVTIALHLANALLFWFLLIKLFRGPSTLLGASNSGGADTGCDRRPGDGVEWVGGLLFAVHPLAVESVAWISELKNTLSLFFLLLAMIAYVDCDTRWSALSPTRSLDSVFNKARWGQRAPPESYFLSLFFFLLALLSKSSVVMLPVALLLHAWWKRGRIVRADIMASAPFFALSLLLGAVTVRFQHHQPIIASHVLAGGLLSRLACSGLALAFYFSKSIWPAGLIPIYPRWELDPPRAAQFLPWLALAVLFGWLWSKRKGWGRHALFGLGFFAVNLLPVSGLIQMSYMYITWVADHFAYISLLGVAGLAAAAMELFRSRIAAWFALALIAGALAITSHRYVEIFRNSQTLWLYTLQRNPQAWTARNNLGLVFSHIPGRLNDAIAQYEEVLRLKPDYPEAHNNLGNVWFRMPGRLNDAIAEYEEALRLKPDYPEAHNNLGNAWLKMPGRLNDAIAEYKKALRLKPDFAGAHNNLGNAWTKIPQRLNDAIAEYEEALRLKPDFAEAHFGLALALLHAPGRGGEAKEHLEAFLRLWPDKNEAKQVLAKIQTSQP